MKKEIVIAAILLLLLFTKSKKTTTGSVEGFFSFQLFPAVPGQLRSIAVTTTNNGQRVLNESEGWITPGGVHFFFSKLNENLFRLTITEKGITEVLEMDKNGDLIF